MQIRTERVQGEPIQTGERRIIPLAQRTTGVRYQATLGHSVTAQGGGFVSLRPLGVVVQKEGSERFLPIRNYTAQALMGILVVAVVVPVLLIIATRLARR